MSVASVTGFLDVLRQNHLLTSGQCEELISAQDQFADPRALAKELVRRGWLTPYQVNQLFLGKVQELLLGPYLLLERLGEGGMGTVYKARNWKVGKIVALKVIRKERLQKVDVVKRFQREIRAAIHLSHPNVVMAYDADEVAGTLYFAMEYVDGIDLAQLVKASGPLPVPVACDYVRQAALGLQHAHERGLVHRDIKPHNLLVTPKPTSSSTIGTVKILDMGLARLVQCEDGESLSALTQEGTVIGTPDYIAPEQAMGAHDVDIRADLYSLGCTLYFLLTGRPPFPGGTLTAKLLQHKLEEPEPVEKLRRDVPAGVAALVRKLMAKRPEDRFQTPAELAQVLARGMPIVGVIPLRVPAGATTPATAYSSDNTLGPSNTVVAPDRPSFWKKRKPLWVLAGAVLCLVLLGLFVGVPSASRPKPALGDTFTNSIGMKLVLIPPGKFIMGSSAENIERAINLKLAWPPPDHVFQIKAEGPQHEVEITRPFYMGAHEVTLGQFRAFVKDTGYKIDKGAQRFLPDGRWTRDADPAITWQTPGFEQTDDHPVVCVNWNDANAFCNWLSKKEGKQYGLPTEAQWEYACRATTTTQYSSGDSDASLRGHANIADESLKTHFAKNSDPVRWAAPWTDPYPFTAPVGSFKPNRFGLYDMHGNVWEWCADPFDPNFYQSSPTQDPIVLGGGEQRMLRGGSWDFAPSHCRSAGRFPHLLSCRHNNFGFRVVLTK
jgi:eukaryotic-like serine/threonine-protein kinase